MKEAIIQYNDNPDADGGHMVINWKPLIRCKDCKFGHWWSTEQVIVCDKLAKTLDAKWFCADGVKKDDV